MTQLRQKMIRQMQLRSLSENTQRAYLQSVSGIAKHYKQSPDKMTKEKIEDYLLYLKQDKKSAPNSVGTVISGLRFLYNHVVCDEQLSPSCAFAKVPRKLPVVLSQEEIWEIINATDNMKHRLMLMATYSAGLRASEVLALRIEDIDSKRMLIKINGKGGKERYTLLSERFLKELRDYYRVYRPDTLLFPASQTGRRLCYEAIRLVYEKARKKAGIKKGAGLHVFKYQQTYPLFPEQYKIVYDLLNCRTEYLGGHIERCNHCGSERIMYNSCRNRHCQGRSENVLNSAG